MGGVTRAEFARLLKERVLFLDGAYGTEFFKRKVVESREPIELLNLKNPEAVLRLQTEYVLAGVDLLLTNTFSANRHKLSMFRVEKYLEEINRRAVEIAKEAARSSWKRVLILGDVSSLGNFPKPMGDVDSRYVFDVFREQAEVLLDAGVDGFIVETMSDLKELKIAYLAIRSVAPDVPLLVSMTFEENGVSVTGTSVEIYLSLFNDLDVDAVGVNCTLTPEKMTMIVRKLAKFSKKPIFAEPNAGKPTLTPDGSLVYRTTPEEFSVYLEDFVEIGANIVGGCCGTGPEHIEFMTHQLNGRRPKKREVEELDVLSNRTYMVNVSPFLIVGERINASARRKLFDSIRSGDISPILKLAKEQETEGANVLDVNLGLEAALDASVFRETVIELDRVVSLPLSLDILNDEMLEAALLEYVGRPLINSAKANIASLTRRLELVKLYGGLLVVLAMDREIPDSPEERYRLGRWAVEFAEAQGVSRNRIFVDPLVLPLGANQDFRVTLKTIELLANDGIRTIAGLSNFSFGMPDRESLNASMLALAMERGLSAVIMNTRETTTLNVLRGMLKVLNKEGQGIRVEHVENDFVNVLLKGDGTGAELFCLSLLETLGPLGVIQKVITTAMEEIGELYASNRIFLPHLILAAETVKPILNKLLQYVGTSIGAKRGRVMLATVEGDIHDIGKRIVATVLESHGFEVVDIGKDVPADVILEKAKQLKPDIVGLSAMMTTTVPQVGEVVRTFRLAGLTIPIVAGGASMNSELAERYGCLYAKDAQAAAKICRELVGDGRRNQDG